MAALLTDTPAIETERLILRPHALSDRAAIAAIHGEADVMRHVGGQALSEGDSWHHLLRNVGHWTLMGYGLFSVVDREDDTVVGMCGHATFHRGLGDAFDRWPEAAWMFAAHAQGRGIAREAMTAAQDWFDARYHPERTVCIIAPDNHASLRLAERLGYRPTGEARFKDAPVVTLVRRVA